MEYPAGVVFILDTLVQDVSRGNKNSIIRISSFQLTMAEHEFSCAKLSKTPIETDAIEVTLSDKTKWVVIFDMQVRKDTNESSFQPRFKP